MPSVEAWNGLAWSLGHPCAYIVRQMGRNELQGSVREWTMDADGPQIDNQQGILANLVSPEELAERFGINVATLTAWRSQGKGPSYFKAGRKVWYPRDRVEVWIETQIREGSSNAIEKPRWSLAL